MLDKPYLVSVYTSLYLDPTTPTATENLQWSQAKKAFYYEYFL